MADFGEALNTFETLGDVFNPPLTVHVADSDTQYNDQATEILIELPPGFEPKARGLRPLCIAGG